MSTSKGFLEKTFKLNANKTNAKTEIVAGITTFMTMAYILIVNPLTLADAGMNFDGVFAATAISAFVATLVMAFYANYPFVLAPGMGLNAFFAYSVVLGMGYSWEFAITAVLLEGLIFIVLSFFNVREAIVKAIPMSLKNAVSVGIGLFIAFIGLSGAGIVKTGKLIQEGSEVIPNSGGLIVELGNVTSPGAIVAILGIIVTGFLLIRKVKGAILIGIIFSTIAGIVAGITELPQNIFTDVSTIGDSLSKVAFKFQFDQIFTIDMLIVLFTFLFVDMFDTIGTLVGVASKADMLDENGNLPKAKQALLADAVGTTVGACLGTSTVTTYVESASGVAEGGKTGLTAFTSAILFGAALFLAPLFGIIPTEATTPALVLVGLFMMSPILKINFEDFTEAIPAFLTIIMMPLAYSIAEGIAFGMISYVILKVLSGKFKDVSPVMYILAILFVLKFIV
ncbi:NCS2 family permease [Sporosalibacterium faouarense]|uniref:NCS2 family permease n=1 Tax=Sporosalibacterium faouarense TaxID=516123 RepID=UPI001A9C5CA2|nr:NCS2 family permease [Sporosalibacterium faouarense]